MEVKTSQQFIEALKFAYTELGMYPKYFITSDGACLSWQSAKNNAEQICQAIEDKSSCGWRVVACDVNWEDGELYCDHSNKRIESAYAEPETL
jgi:hypothetical protein